MEDHHGHDLEVNAAFQRTGGSLQPPITTTFVQANAVSCVCSDILHRPYDIII